jgi:hypothetical protein
VWEYRRDTDAYTRASRASTTQPEVCAVVFPICHGKKERMPLKSFIRRRRSGLGPLSTVPHDNSHTPIILYL